MRIVSIVFGLFMTLMMSGTPSLAINSDDINDNELILVAGASGRTGVYVLKYLKAEGRNFIAMTSNRERAIEKVSDDYNWVEADVKDLKTLEPIMAGVTKIISGLGSTKFEGPNSPEHIDYGGIKNLVDVAEAAGTVDQIVLMSSSGVTQKDNPLNRFGNGLTWKLKGEDYLRASSISHTVVRAGGLTNTEAGIVSIRLQQGDRALNGGMTGRGNFAAICIEALTNQDAKNKTFEPFDDKTLEPDTWLKVFSKLIPDEKQ
jgi:uncharacterized protein YbjT (DUF2867 family)